MTTLLKKHQSLLVFLAKVVGGTALLALGAHIKVMLPFSPVPVTGQTLALAFIALSYGRRDAVYTVLAYYAQGLAGLPVFTLLSGPAIFVSPTAGYLYGMLPAAYLMGACADRGCLSSPLKTAAAVFLGIIAVIYGFGIAWLSFFVPADSLLGAGLLPFLPGDAAKIFTVLLALPLLRKLKQ